MKVKELGELLDILREKGVTEYEAEGDKLKLKLGPVDSPSSVVPSKGAKVKAAFKEMMEAPARKPTGPDGLTKEQQEEIYGVAIDDIPDTDLAMED